MKENGENSSIESNGSNKEGSIRHMMMESLKYLLRMDLTADTMKLPVLQIEKQTYSISAVRFPNNMI